MIIWLRDYPALTDGLAFAATQAVSSALNAQSIAPNGYPVSAFTQGMFTWEQMMTAVE